MIYMSTKIAKYQIIQDKDLQEYASLFQYTNYHNSISISKQTHIWIPPNYQKLTALNKRCMQNKSWKH